MTDYNRRFKTLLALDAFLALAIILGIALSPRSAEARSTRRDLLADASDVSAIRIEGPEVVELSKSGGSWTYLAPDGGLPADGARIEAFLKAVDSVERLEPVARDKSSWASLGLEGESARKVSLSDAKGSVVCEFTLGSYAQSSGSVYLAPEGGSQAYLASSGMASYALGDRSSWLDLRAWTAPPTVESVQEIAFEGGQASQDGVVESYDFTVSKSGSGWTAKGIALDPAKVEALVRALASIRGDDYAPASEAKAAQGVGVELRLGNGRSARLSIEERREDGRFAVASSQRERRLYVPAWALAEALKTLDELKP
ncbi:MAG: DUF4340 domain-containing protein [Spirochaetes bacterium]|nr:DUF4340 domain-containing protein [Spirochaetota bacterium]MBU1080555.1 DUF4340 domain-containing protein [Spirochaetota bacterium]